MQGAHRVEWKAEVHWLNATKKVEQTMNAGTALMKTEMGHSRTDLEWRKLA